MAVTAALWGPSGTGKTTLAVKLANVLSERGSVAVVFCDRDNPPLPALFPLHRPEELRSLGSALSAVEITEEKVMEAATVSASRNIIYLGYSGGENRYSYPTFGPGRAVLFLNLMSRLADYVIYDCPALLYDNPLPQEALKAADCVFRLYRPELSSFFFYESQLPVLAGEEYRTDRHRKIVNCTEGDICLPESEAVSLIGDCDAKIPYLRLLRQQSADGTLPSGGENRRLRAALGRLIGCLPEENN